MTIVSGSIIEIMESLRLDLHLMIIAKVMVIVVIVKKMMYRRKLKI